MANSLGITPSIRNIFIEETDSPWNEKALIKRKKAHLDVKLTIWKDTLFMYGRIDKLSSNTFRDLVNELLNFAAYHCKDAHIASSYYGISFICQGRVFAEMIPTKNNLLFLTLLDAQSNLHETYKITEGSDMGVIQKTIKDTYHKISFPSHF